MRPLEAAWKAVSGLGEHYLGVDGPGQSNLLGQLLRIELAYRRKRGECRQTTIVPVSGHDMIIRDAFEMIPEDPRAPVATSGYGPELAVRPAGVQNNSSITRRCSAFNTWVADKSRTLGEIVGAALDADATPAGGPGPQAPPEGTATPRRAWPPWASWESSATI
jgi:hypothetical protein